jgi:hypothetical protein
MNVEPLSRFIPHSLAIFNIRHVILVFEKSVEGFRSVSRIAQLYIFIITIFLIET